MKIYRGYKGELLWDIGSSREFKNQSDDDHALGKKHELLQNEKKTVEVFFSLMKNIWCT